jgi:putative endonuclease
MIGCYIIHSKQLRRYYVGVTQDDLTARIVKHNESSYGTHRFTSRASDWELYLFIPTSDYPHAVRIERKIKSMKSSVYIENLQKYPELLAQLVSST